MDASDGPAVPSSQRVLLNLFRLHGPAPYHLWTHPTATQNRLTATHPCHTPHTAQYKMVVNIRSHTSGERSSLGELHPIHTCMRMASSSSSYRLLYFFRFRAISRCASSLSRLGGRGRQDSCAQRGQERGRVQGGGEGGGQAGQQGWRRQAGTPRVAWLAPAWRRGRRCTTASPPFFLQASALPPPAIPPSLPVATPLRSAACPRQVCRSPPLLRLPTAHLEEAPFVERRPTVHHRTHHTHSTQGAPPAAPGRSAPC